MDIFAEWKRNPPGLSLGATLEDVVADFKTRFTADRRDTVVDYCAEAEDLNTAMRRAVASRAANGKMHNHQSKMTAATRAAVVSAMSGQLPLLAAQTTFDELHDAVAGVIDSIDGVGPLALYDFSLRIGAYLKLAPDSVYLHAGVRKGAKALGLPYKQHRLLRAELPAALQALPADDVEDLLCTYRMFFESKRKSVNE